MIEQGIARPGTGNGDDRTGKCHTHYVTGLNRAHERRSGYQMMLPPDARAIDPRIRFNDKYDRLPGLPKLAIKLSGRILAA